MYEEEEEKEEEEKKEDRRARDQRWPSNPNSQLSREAIWKHSVRPFQITLRETHTITHLAPHKASRLTCWSGALHRLRSVAPRASGEPLLLAFSLPPVHCSTLRADGPGRVL